ncbi:MAG TPA: ABC transporter permease [Roseiflexaceae bacterium]|nr:ABC transporter permease [Roseiflexaceae bacterium]HMP43280.1 ABC transporter permease [Roseiflexaceae bacterium]
MPRTTAEPHVYDSDARQDGLVHEVGELLSYRSLIRLLIISQLKQRYRRSTLGLLWAFIGPLLNTIVLSIAFTALFNASIERYPVYVLTGLVAWQFFSQTSAQGVEAAVSGSGLLQRVYLPRSIFVIAATGSGLINMALALVALLVTLLATATPMHPTWLFLPPAVILLAMFTLGITLLVASLAIAVGDVAHMYQIGLQALFFLCPIVYPRSIVPPEFGWIIDWNPLILLIDLFRALLYHGELPPIGSWFQATAIAVGLLSIGYLLFIRHGHDNIANQ